MRRERINRCSVWAVWPRWCTTEGRRACFFGSLFSENPNNVPFDFKKAKEGRGRRKRRRKDFFQTLRPSAEQARACPRSALSCYRWWWLKIKEKSIASRLPRCPTSSQHSLSMLSPQNDGGWSRSGGREGVCRATYLYRC